MIEEPEIFKVAAALPAEERASYLDAACSDQPGARERVEELLRHHDATGFMDVEAIAPLSAEIEAELARLKPEASGDRLGHYTLLEQIGEGGFGTVWVADQDVPVRRRVALKIIKLGMDTKEVVARFEQERQALALMDHPNIARVLDAGATPTGRPFFVMELVRGIKITDYCDQANLPTAERLELFVTVCNAVQHAHQKGIIHRDIKPSNILVTLQNGQPVPKVIDFGVAKATQQQRLTDLTIYTQLEQMIGTPLYMSPEQAEMSGLDIDTRSDIYSLGVLLYELLTGRTPFDPKELMQAGFDEMRRVIREKEPQKPSTALQTMSAEIRTSVGQRRQVVGAKMAGMLRGDLDWIVMKALEKDRTRRYETANGFAEDIRRHLSNEAVTAAAPSVSYLFSKFARRNKVAIGVSAFVAVVLVTATAISLWQAGVARVAKKDAEVAFGQVAQKKAEVDRKNDEYRAMLVEAARSDRFIAEEKLRTGQEREAFAHLVRACEYDPSSMIVAAEKATTALSAWQYPVPLLVLAGDEGPILSAHFSPNGTRVVTTTRDKIARLWDADTGRSLLTFTGHSDVVFEADFNHDGTRVVTCSRDETARVWNTETGQSIAVLSGHTGHVRHVQFSRDGKRIVTASDDHTAMVWEGSTGKSLFTLEGHTDEVASARFSPDGTSIVTASFDKTAKVWDVVSGKNVVTLAGHEDKLWSAEFSPDGTHIVTGSCDRTAQLWDVSTGKSIATFAGHERELFSTQFSPDGSRLVTASFDGTARVWDTTSGKSLGELLGHGVHVFTARFSPDGTRIVTASLDKTARIWDAQTGKCLAILAGHEQEVRDASFSGDGKRIVTHSNDGSARVWDAVTDKSVAVLSDHEGPVMHARFSPDGMRIVTASTDTTARVWDANTGKSIATLKGHEKAVWNAQFSPDGLHVATASYDGTGRIWDAATGKSIAVLEGHKGRVWSVQFSPDGTRIATSSQDNTARVWDAASGKSIAVLEGHKNSVWSPRFSPDGAHIVTASHDGTARVWDAATGKPQFILAGHEREVWSAQFSPDGAHIVTASFDGTARVWDAASGQSLITLDGKEGPMDVAQYSPDGTRIVTGSFTNTARVWDASNGKCLVNLVGHKNAPGVLVCDAQFSPDGTRIVTASYDNTARVWDATTGKCITIVAGHKNHLSSARFNSHGTRIVTASEDGTSRVLTILPPHAGVPPEWFPAFLRYMAQMRLNADGELMTLKREEWLALRDQMRKALHDGIGKDTTYLRTLRYFVSQ